MFLPGQGIFASRSRRFQDLAASHALGDYLQLMGRLAQAQQTALEALPPLPLPAPVYLDHCRQQHLPPLGVLGWQRDQIWQEVLQLIIKELAEEELPKATIEALNRLSRMAGDDLEKVAADLLRHDLAKVPAEVAPFVAAALQVYWTAMAAALPGPDLARLPQANLCPVCGSLPVAAIVRCGGAENGLRYLCCSLCSSQWHMVRGICSNCEATEDLTYFSIEGQSGPVSAESCGDCHTYLKIIKLDKDPQAEPLTDDLAMLALDLLMDQEGQAPNGANLFFHPGNG